MSSAPALNAPHPLAGIETPCLVLDEDRMLHNIDRLKTRLARLGVPLRPHLKTAKSVPAARAVMDSPAGPAAVS
ncbi:DSD1 family PLP-dependent enzyme, partial [Bradyrhizobium sp. UFLA01-814]